MKSWVRSHRHTLTMAQIFWPAVSRKLRGHYAYYGKISGNSRKLSSFYRITKALLYKWMTRRSQRKKWTWAKFEQYLQQYPCLRRASCIIGKKKCDAMPSVNGDEKSRMWEICKSGSVREGLAIGQR